MDEITNIEETYNNLIGDGVPKEDARYILPNACTTDLYLSCNLRELIHIANERLCTRAQWEIRELVKRMVALVDPSLQFMLVPKCKSGWIICNSPCGTRKEDN
jgi:thymidylate synthase (FAD)